MSFRIVRIPVFAVCFFPLQLLAQNYYGLRQIVFDPVPIQIEQLDAGADASQAFVVTELASLPSTNPITLEHWLSQRTSVVTGNQDTLKTDIRSYEQSVLDLELAEGPYAEQLPQQLLALGSALQADGELDRALEIFNKASHVARINNGLFSAEQVPVIRKTIENHLLRGDLVEADNQQKYLFYLQQKNLGFDSTDLLPALNAYADWNIYAFSADIFLPSSMDWNQDQAEQVSVTPLVNTRVDLRFRVERLINAQNIYWSIIQILRNNFGTDYDRLLDYEMRLALTNYFFATAVPPNTDAYALTDIGTSPMIATSKFPAPSLSNMGYRHGRDALTRRRDYMLEMPKTDYYSLLKANMDLADWMLYFRRQRNKAMDDYIAIYSEFNDKLSAEQLASVFNPPYPTRLPSFIRTFNSREAYDIPADQALVYRGYIDIGFELNRYGDSENVHTLGMSAGTPPEVEIHLLRNLRSAHFRPRFVGNQPILSDKVHARYYYAY